MSDQAYDLARRLAAEAIGTGFLLATVVGSGIMGETLAGGNVAIALLGNTIPTGAILVVLILMFGPISGAHFNPAVTLSFLIQGKVAAGDAVAYVIVQIGAAILGAWAAHLMFEEPLFMFSEKVRTGGGQWVAEIIATFGLVATIIACVRHRAEAVPLRRRSLHHSSLLVHRLHLLRQPGRHHRPHADRHLQRHPPRRRPAVHRLSNRRCAAGDLHPGVALE